MHLKCMKWPENIQTVQFYYVEELSAFGQLKTVCGVCLK